MGTTTKCAELACGSNAYVVMEMVADHTFSDEKHRLTMAVRPPGGGRTLSRGRTWLVRNSKQRQGR